MKKLTIFKIESDGRATRYIKGDLNLANIKKFIVEDMYNGVIADDIKVIGNSYLVPYEDESYKYEDVLTVTELFNDYIQTI